MTKQEIAEAYEQAGAAIKLASDICLKLKDADPVGQHRAMGSRLSQAQSYLDKLKMTLSPVELQSETVTAQQSPAAEQSAGDTAAGF